MGEPSNNFESNSDTINKKSNSFIGCFLVENDSFLEIRDCFIRSVKDLKVIEREKEMFANAEAGGTSVVITE
jgi:hypothetical protein